jgi:hypothetical protein
LEVAGCRFGGSRRRIGEFLGFWRGIPLIMNRGMLGGKWPPLPGPLLLARRGRRPLGFDGSGAPSAFKQLGILSPGERERRRVLAEPEDDGLAQASGLGVFRVAVGVVFRKSVRLMQGCRSGFDVAERQEQGAGQVSGPLQGLGETVKKAVVARARGWERVFGGQKMGESTEELGEEGQTDGAGDPRGGEECEVWRRHRMSLSFGLRGARPGAV